MGPPAGQEVADGGHDGLWARAGRVRRTYPSESRRLARPPAMAAPGTPERACWACGVSADALRRRSKGHRLLLDLPAAGLLVLVAGGAGDE